MSPVFEQKLVELAAESLLGGEALVSLNQALAEIARDVLDRPHVGAVRSASLKITVKAVVLASGAMRPEIKFAVSKNVPSDTHEVPAFALDGGIQIYERTPEQLALIEAEIKFKRGPQAVVPED